MARFLFVVIPIDGHVFPTIAVGRELAERGHEVAWAGHAEGVGDRLPEWARFIPVATAVPDEVETAIRETTARSVTGAAAFVGVWREFVVPVARQMLPGVHAAIDAFGPDVVVVDQQTIAGAVAAEVRGLPWATSATTSVELISWLGTQLGDHAAAFLDPAMLLWIGKLRDWLGTVIGDLVVELGLPPDRAPAFEPRFSPSLVVAFTTAELLGIPASFPEHFALVGPSIGDRPAVDTPFPWEWLDDTKPLVLVSLGTLNWRGGARFFKVSVEALSEMDVQAVLVAPDGVESEPPPDILVRDRIPQLALLPHVDAVVSHGGHGTVSETLSVGRPLVIAPIRDDQPVIADQVARAGAGLTVRYMRVDAVQLRDALRSVLTDERFRKAAERLRSSFAAAGGPARAADRLEMLATDRTVTGGRPLS